MGKSTRYRYSVYYTKTEMPLVIYGTAKECAAAMGITKCAFHKYLSRGGKHKTRKWMVYRDEMYEGEIEG